MNIPNQNEVLMRRKLFPIGSRVRLLGLAEDGGPQETLPLGSEGTVRHVDAIGTVHVDWDSGSSLGALLEDRILPV